MCSTFVIFRNEQSGGGLLAGAGAPGAAAVTDVEMEARKIKAGILEIVSLFGMLWALSGLLFPRYRQRRGCLLVALYRLLCCVLCLESRFVQHAPGKCLLAEFVHQLLCTSKPFVGPTCRCSRLPTHRGAKLFRPLLFRSNPSTCLIFVDMKKILR